ncbi:MAG: flagellar hook-basal body complex protein FliE [Nitratiruptor sp.]|nr:flagellar hook-basal body complex protein FliE [Nitratiruptor sp.]NPA84267.1 flagellar hook-basal body complex protein FliE [Campylobacterota bacterium]
MRVDGVAGGGELLASTPQKDQGGSFQELVLDLLAETNQELHEAARAQEALVAGEVENMVELMVSIEKADISLRMVTELRNKAIEAYQEIMRMQV